jgi:polyphosphate kinase 2 (PPK2 family)
MANGKDKRRLAALRMNAALDDETFVAKLLKLQKKLTLIQQAYLFSRDSAVLVFEGWDAAGKGGIIRRISAALDPRSFKVWPIGAPRSYYAERHYLARFWDKLPPRGSIACFDRSWYGRVLVERVEGFAPEARWRAAYDEINEFEAALIADGTRVVKIFLHITPEVQLARFQQRLTDPTKRWKLSYEDFRNRGKWAAYEDAIEEMLARTSTKGAPWTLVAGNDKKHARIAAMTEIVERLSRGVDLSPPAVDPALLDEARRHLGFDDETLARIGAPAQAAAE